MCIIEHFGNADAVPQPPERCLSRKAGIVRKNPFTLTSKAVDNDKYQALLANETRYSRLTRAFPDRAKELFARNQQVANDRYEHLTRLVDLYK